MREIITRMSRFFENIYNVNFILLNMAATSIGDIGKTRIPLPSSLSKCAFLQLLFSVLDRHRFAADLDPDPIFHFDAHPDPDPDSDWHQTMPVHMRILLQVLHKLENWAKFIIYYSHQY
jgi:hypothetical protein